MPGPAAAITAPSTAAPLRVPRAAINGKDVEQSLFHAADARDARQWTPVKSTGIHCLQSSPSKRDHLTDAKGRRVQLLGEVNRFNRHLGYSLPQQIITVDCGIQ
ncbi:hypothetical protein PPNSA23_03300 [Phyllobacterium phragmitis]|uniref:Uncharacterized protein n=1 Tax=Phyllobacterium phragmitis TaxID=2670329 RepID=A0ABQ0GUP1_9HYPH